ncbi:DUF1634 domain-containing protein [Mucilaginibacter sp. KACC 22063]|uniref:DUF1634 domain-containing protein n=1 Tax=Mucilaginibacter sp. KACC 22063 TaxID=3025666 RepID=UPI002366EC9E|nr:DUF1634 domain-containing protein [Mucilaginibacter sp. KACC 22063]WDF56587.1 DUF1634 domain-containing protein [Mucilaginibacter sp. KACC 22063]
MTGSNFKDKDMQAVIGWVLRLGVIISMAVVFIGGVIYLYRHGHTIADYKTFSGVPEFLQTPRGILNGIVTFRGRAIIQAGIVLLIATPVIRIICSAIGFIMEKDYLYTGITIFVLMIIVIGMFTGHAG